MCFHSVHTECLRKKCLENKKHNKSVNCPVCNKLIQDVEIFNVLTNEEKVEIEKYQIKQLIELNPNMK